MYPDSEIIIANSKASELLGLSLDQMLGKKEVDPNWKFKIAIIRNDFG
jgi:hypothetical protein